MYLDFNPISPSSWVRNILIRLPWTIPHTSCFSRDVQPCDVASCLSYDVQPCDVALAGLYREISQSVYSRGYPYPRFSSCWRCMRSANGYERVCSRESSSVRAIPNLGGHESLEWVSEGSHVKQIKMHIYAVEPSDILDIQFAVS